MLVLMKAKKRQQKLIRLLNKYNDNSYAVVLVSILTIAALVTFATLVGVVLMLIK